jgi:hypothetical protein
MKGDGESQGLDFMFHHDFRRISFQFPRNPRSLLKRSPLKKPFLGESMLFGIESEGLPHERRPGLGSGHRVKASRLDEAPDILEMKPEAGAIQELLKGGEWPVFRTLMHDRLFCLMAQVLELHEAHPDLLALSRVLDFVRLMRRKGGRPIRRLRRRYPKVE